MARRALDPFVVAFYHGLFSNQINHATGAPFLDGYAFDDLPDGERYHLEEAIADFRRKVAAVLPLRYEEEAGLDLADSWTSGIDVFADNTNTWGDDASTLQEIADSFPMIELYLDDGQLHAHPYEPERFGDGAEATEASADEAGGGYDIDLSGVGAARRPPHVEARYDQAYVADTTGGDRVDQVLLVDEGWTLKQAKQEFERIAAAMPWDLDDVWLEPHAHWVAIFVNQGRITPWRGPFSSVAEGIAHLRAEGLDDLYPGAFEEELAQERASAADDGSGYDIDLSGTGATNRLLVDFVEFNGWTFEAIPHADPNSLGYRIEVTDENGEMLWSESKWDYEPRMALCRSAREFLSSLATPPLAAGYAQFTDDQAEELLREFDKQFCRGQLPTRRSQATAADDGSGYDIDLSGTGASQWTDVVPLGAPYYTVLVPPSDNPTIWHGDTTLTRGAFPTVELAHEWAREKLGGQPYEVRFVPADDDSGYEIDLSGVGATPSEEPAGFTVSTYDQMLIEENARERFGVKYGDPQDRAKQLAAGFIDNTAEITTAGWEQINKDIAKIEENTLRWLRANFNSVRVDGHADAVLYGVVWFHPTNLRQAELISLASPSPGASERIDMVDASYGDLAHTAFDGVSDFGGSVLGGAVHFEDVTEGAWAIIEATLEAGASSRVTDDGGYEIDLSGTQGSADDDELVYGDDSDADDASSPAASGGSGVPMNCRLDPARADVLDHTRWYDIDNILDVDQLANGDDVHMNAYGQNNHAQRTNNADWFEHEYLTGSDYSGDIYTKVNRNVVRDRCVELLEDPDTCQSLWFLETYGHHGSYGLLINARRAPDEIIEMLERLNNYPSLDDDAVGEAEDKADAEAWESWARNDYKRALETTYPSWDFDAVTDEAWLEHFDRAREAANVYWETEHQARHIDIDRIVKDFAEDDAQNEMPEGAVEVADDSDSASAAPVDSTPGDGTDYDIDLS